MTAPEKTDIAVWRYGIISPLFHRDEEGGSLENALIQLASRPFRKLDGSFAIYSPETLRKWLYRYRKGGFPPLRTRTEKTRAPTPRFRKRSKNASLSCAGNIPGGVCPACWAN